MSGPHISLQEGNVTSIEIIRSGATGHFLTILGIFQAISFGILFTKFSRVNVLLHAKDFLITVTI